MTNSIQIIVSLPGRDDINITVSPNEKIEVINDKCNFYGDVIYKGERLKGFKTIESYNIKNGDKLSIQEELDCACIDNIKTEVDLNIGFDMNLIKRNELHVNLIHFDLNMTNSENYGYFNQFKVDVIGGFYAIDNIDIFKNYLEEIKQKDIPFIVITSGSSGKDIIPICKQYSFIKEVIIFCGNYKYNEHYIKEYPGFVNKVFTSISSLYEYIKTFGADKYKDGIEKFKFSQEEIKMDRQIQQCPVITSSEYDKCYFLIHKAYSHFFGDINNKYEEVKFNEINFNKIKESLNKIKFIEQNEKDNLISEFKNLLNIKNNNIFVEKSIKYYTGESSFCYLFNRIMRNFEPGLVSFSYYMGPLLYGLNKYVKENPNVCISNDMTLYRRLNISKTDFYLYKLNLGHIICFPSLTSTSSQDINFTPTSLSQSTSGNDKKETSIIKIKFTYKHKNGNISPGIILENKKGHDGSYLSCCPDENEVLLFPFTFARINGIKSDYENNKLIEMEIINRNSYIEQTLKNNVEKRIFFSHLD